MLSGRWGRQVAPYGAVGAIENKWLTSRYAEWQEVYCLYELEECDA